MERSGQQVEWRGATPDSGAMSINDLCLALTPCHWFTRILPLTSVLSTALHLSEFSETLGLGCRHRLHANEELFYIGCIKLSRTSYWEPYIIVEHSLVDCRLPVQTFNYPLCVSCCRSGLQSCVNLTLQLEGCLPLLYSSVTCPKEKQHRGSFVSLFGENLSQIWNIQIKVSLPHVVHIFLFCVRENTALFKWKDNFLILWASEEMILVALHAGRLQT